MGYADGLLTSGERVVHREKQHWWVFVWGAKFTILARSSRPSLILILSSGISLGRASPGRSRPCSAGSPSPCSSAASRCSSGRRCSTSTRSTSSPTAGSSRPQGVVNKRAADSSLEKINDAVLTQSIFGRALGFGDLKILTASEAAISEFRMLVEPDRVQEGHARGEARVRGRGRRRQRPHRRRRSAPTRSRGALHAGRRRDGERRGPGRRSGRGDVRASTIADEVTRTLAQPGRPARPRCDHARGVRAQEGGPARAALRPARRYHTRDPSPTTSRSPLVTWRPICRSSSRWRSCCSSGSRSTSSATRWRRTGSGDGTAKLFGRLTLNPVAHFDPLGGILLAVTFIGSGGDVRVRLGEADAGQPVEPAGRPPRARRSWRRPARSRT